MCEMVVGEREGRGHSFDDLTSPLINNILLESAVPFVSSNVSRLPGDCARAQPYLSTELTLTFPDFARA